MTNITSIATATPAYCHKQDDILSVMQEIYSLGKDDARILSFLYNHSSIDTRYSVINDFSIPRSEWKFLPTDPFKPFPLIEERMRLFQQEALPLCIKAATECTDQNIRLRDITHLITVSCTGMSAPGLDIQLIESLRLSNNINRISVNFMGCYAAIHALKLAHLICTANHRSNVLIVDIELCTIHFQKEYTQDNAASSLLFADGCAAVLVSGKSTKYSHIALNDFFSQVSLMGKKHMTWDINSKGFMMTLSGYIPGLIKEDISELVNSALLQSNWTSDSIEHWCIHPGGRKILDVVESKLNLSESHLELSRKVLAQFGNMSSATILFILKEILYGTNCKPGKIFGAAFGPGLTMETFTAVKYL